MEPYSAFGATTLDEYRNSIEKDGALERRFQKVLVEPTTVDETLQILNNIKDRYEAHHHVSYTDDAITACVKLTDRYITDRSFPDKAIDAMDEVGGSCTSTKCTSATRNNRTEKAVGRDYTGEKGRSEEPKTSNSQPISVINKLL